jgi:hypothetical protein
MWSAEVLRPVHPGNLRAQVGCSARTRLRSAAHPRVWYRRSTAGLRAQDLSWCSGHRLSPRISAEQPGSRHLLNEVIEADRRGAATHGSQSGRVRPSKSRWWRRSRRGAGRRPDPRRSPGGARTCLLGRRGRSACRERRPAGKEPGEGSVCAIAHVAGSKPAGQGRRSGNSETISGRRARFQIKAVLCTRAPVTTPSPWAFLVPVWLAWPVQPGS